MPDAEPGAEVLQLREDFSASSTQEWEAAIRADLKGADYAKKLVWRTDEGISVRPYYRREDAPEPLAEVGAHTGWDMAQEWEPPAAAVRADYLHEAGATAVQELAYGLAEAVEQLAGAHDASAAASRVAFVFAAGSNYFMQIAKLRAARLLWANVVAAFAPGTENVTPARIHVRTARRNKSIYDPYTNLLRVTTEALSAVVGGCDSLTIEPFGFSEHLAEGVQRILKEESHAGRVADPAAGCWFIEWLTDALARESWSLFQQVEGRGGWSNALASGWIEESLETARDAKAAAIASRRRTLVGVNSYPDLNDKTSGVVPPSPFSSDPFDQSRLAEPYERIRARTAAYAAETGRYPIVLLLKRGDVKMRRARANFCLNFFGCAGFDIVESDRYEGVAADLIVLCSSDPEYTALAREVCAQVNVPVLVAGNPKETIDELKAAGVQGFVHLQSNAVATLTQWQNRLGIGREP